jgi:hypothetical protein
MLGLAGIVLGGFLLLSEQAFAYRGDPSVKGPNYSEERLEAMTNALESNDYNAWKELMQGRGRVLQVINEQNFSRFAEAHKLALSGTIDEARKIREELGLGVNNGFGQGMGRGNCNR